MRYTLEKQIRISLGIHQIFVALPGDDFVKQFEINLTRGDLNVLEQKPIYLENNFRKQTCKRY